LDNILKKIRLTEINPQIAANEIEKFIVDTVISAKKQGAVLGLSGGIDSTIVAYLTRDAFQKYNENHPENKLKLYGLILPAKANKSEDSEDGVRVAESLGIEYEIIQIQPIIETFRETLRGKVESDFDKGNLSSETRAILLSREAAYRNSLVLGTGNKDEDYCLGYFTKRGDGAIDLSPIGELSKRQVRQLADYKGVTKDLVQRISTAGLWEGQTDEGELGFSYLHAEIVVSGKDQGYSRDEIKEITQFGDIVDKVLNMHKNNQFKMHMPPVAKLSEEAKK